MPQREQIRDNPTDRRRAGRGNPPQQRPAGVHSDDCNHAFHRHSGKVGVVRVLGEVPQRRGRTRLAPFAEEPRGDQPTLDQGVPECPDEPVRVIRGRRRFYPPAAVAAAPGIDIDPSAA